MDNKWRSGQLVRVCVLVGGCAMCVCACACTCVCCARVYTCTEVYKCMYLSIVVSTVP